MKGEVSKHVFSCPTLNEKVLKDVGMQPHIIAIPLESNARALLCKYANEATKPKQEMKAALPVASPSGKRGRRSLKSVDSEGNAIASG